MDGAVRCASFVLRELRDEQGRLLRTWKDGRARLSAYLEDHAFLLEALLGLYEATGDPRWYSEARGLGDVMIERFSDPERGGFYTTASDHEPLAARRKDLEDSPIPSGNSAAAFGLLRLGPTFRRGLLRAARARRAAAALPARRAPLPGLRPPAQAADFYLAPVKEVAIVGPEAEAGELLRVIRGAYRPHLVLASGRADGVPLLEGREPVDGHAAAYVCEHFVCQAPVTRPDELAAAL